MKPLNSFLSVILLSSSALSQAQITQPVYSRVKIHVPAQGIAYLQANGIEIDHGEWIKEDNTFITTLSAAELVNLKQTGTAFSVLLEDEAASFRQTSFARDFYNNAGATMVNGRLQFEQSCGSQINAVEVPVGFIPGSYGGYYTFAEMQSRIDSLVRKYPAIVQKFTLPGITYEGRSLIVVKISDNVATDENEPEALYTGLHHAREGMSMMNLFFFMQYLAEQYSSDKRIKDLVDSRELFFIPCVNPDGYVYNQTSAPGGGGMWRKNRRNNGSSYGVDLNRNYNVDWGISGANISTSTTPSNDAYVGPAAFSEPETQAIRSFARTRHFTIAIDHHAYGNYYVTPYGVPANHAFTPADVNFYKYASALMSRYNGYFAGDGMATVNYYAVGNSRDWHIAGDLGQGTKEKTYGYTVEIGSSNYGFWPSAANIIPISKSMFFANMQMAYMAGSYIELQDINNLAITSATGQFTFSARRIGLKNDPVTITIIPLQNIQHVGDAVTISSLANYFDTVQRSIAYTLSPAAQRGDRIRFVYRIETGGITLQDTITKYFQPVTLLYDNMEGTVTNNWTLTGTWNTSTTAAFEGSRSLSESPAGAYSNNSTTTATCKTIFNLSDATSAWLSFWVKHRAENSKDYLQIQLSGNGIGSGANFQPACGQLTVAENVGSLGGQPALTGIREAWSHEIISLQSYLGNANVGLRFRFSANTSGNDDGFYIDNLELIKSTGVLLSDYFMHLQAQRVANGNLLSWEAVTAGNLAYFEVQSSATGSEFFTAGQVGGPPPYRFIDRVTAPDNFYRIKAVNLDGHVEYSSIVAIKNDQADVINLYHLPADNHVSLRFSLQKATAFHVCITDITGQLQQQAIIDVAAGNSTQVLPLHKQAAGLYMVTIINQQTKSSNVYKYIKQ